MVDAGLVTQNPVTLERVAVLAEELPSVKKGTWKIDTQKKTMITVYKLRPGLTWHDGKPYTSKDFEFGWQIAKHPEFPMPDRLVPDLISKIETPDDRTIVIHWNDLYNEAYAIQYTHVRAFPRHLLQEAFSAGDMKAFANLPYWNKNFVGAGPYRVVEWDAGTRMELEAFKDFTLGRPKIDRVTYKTVEDTNTNLAAVLAGEVDLCMRSMISFDGAMILREQWEKPGKGKIHISPASWSWLNLSRDNPWLSDVKVRRALLHAIDREAMVQNLFKGEKIVSHLPLSRVRKSYKKALATATLYKYDPETAKKLSLKPAGSRDRTVFWLMLKGSAWNSSFASRRSGATTSRPRRSSPTIGRRSASGPTSKTCLTGCSMPRKTATVGPALSSEPTTLQSKNGRSGFTLKIFQTRRTSLLPKTSPVGMTREKTRFSTS